MPIVGNLINSFSDLNKVLGRRIEQTGAPITTFGLFGAINFPLFYLIWYFYGQGAFTNLTMRLIAFLLCLPLIVKNYWPRKIAAFLPLYWYLTVLYSLPFFGTYMFLANHASTIWLTNAMVGLFWLILVVDWLSFTILLPLGFLLGLTYYLAQGHEIYFVSPNMTGSFLNYLWAIVIAAVFSHSREKIQRARLEGMETLSASIAHELRTPLRQINFGASNIKKYLENLIKTYEIASKHGLDVPYIDPLHYQSLIPAFESVEGEARSAYTFIEMLLVKVQQPSLEAYQLETCTIGSCVEEALHRYPFSPEEIERVNWHRNDNFKFKGNQLLIIHVLFNLLKNALFHIKSANKGQIDIWVTKTSDYNILHFKDTGPGIAGRFLPFIFNRFVGNSNQGGTGIGLAFCKYAMRNLQGDIKCSSVAGEFTEFRLFFPRLEDS